MPTFFKRFLVGLIIINLIYSCKEDTLTISEINTKVILIDSSLTPKKSIENIIAPYKKKIKEEINTSISYNPKKLVRTDGNLESSLGNLIADLSYERANPIFKKRTGKNIDFAMFNYGGIRAGINKGDVTKKHAFELMPFENTYVVVELSGNKTEELIKYLIKGNRAHPLSKQIKLTVSKNSYKLKINNKEFDSNKSYFILTTDYLQSGGDKMFFFKNPLQRINLDYKMRDGIIDYFKSVDTLRSSLDGRFTKK